VLDEVAARQTLNLLLVDRRLIGEIEGLQGLDEWKPCHGGPHRHIPPRHILLRLGGHFFGQDLLEEVRVGEFLRGGLLQQRLQAFATLKQAQLQ
jgi:hypothetical protein